MPQVVSGVTLYTPHEMKLRKAKQAAEARARTAKPKPRPKPTYLELVQQRQRKLGESRATAMAAVARSHPELHEAWVNRQCDAAQNRPVRGRKAAGGWMANVRQCAAQKKISLRSALRHHAAAAPAEHEKWLSEMTP